MIRLACKEGLTQRGVTLVETALSIVLVGGVFIAAMTAVGASKTGQGFVADRAKARHLAQDLMTEILVLPYEEPDDAPIRGRESGESGLDRSVLDDIDDYDALDDDPLRSRDGIEKTVLAGWSRGVTVDYVEAADVTTTSLTDQGVKRITVRVRKDGVELASLVAIRTRAGSEALVP